VDEAHHLNVDEQAGMTLAHRLIKKLQDADRLQSLLLFTGTPHRGKHYGFLALMSLVRPDLFDPRRPVEPQLALLPQALVRNNKYHVTNLRGERLFQEPQVSTIPYHYNPEEVAFYQMMTDFIASGRAYATVLQGDRGRTVMLVLIALAKTRLQFRGGGPQRVTEAPGEVARAFLPSAAQLVAHLGRYPTARPLQ
jgi:hypothetical protein